MSRRPNYQYKNHGYHGNRNDVELTGRLAFQELEDRIRKLETGLMTLALNQINTGQKERRSGYGSIQVLAPKPKSKPPLPKYKPRFEKQPKREQQTEVDIKE